MLWAKEVLLDKGFVNSHLPSSLAMFLASCCSFAFDQFIDLIKELAICGYSRLNSNSSWVVLVPTGSCSSWFNLNHTTLLSCLLHFCFCFTVTSFHLIEVEGFVEKNLLVLAVILVASSWIQILNLGKFFWRLFMKQVFKRSVVTGFAISFSNIGCWLFFN